MAQNPAGPLGALPPAHILLASPEARALSSTLSHDALRTLVRGVLDTVRAQVLAGEIQGDRPFLIRHALAELGRAAVHAHTPGLRGVINATGVVLHTNLGRAPLGDEVMAHVAAVARGYATLEYDLPRGRRGHRDAVARPWLTELLGAEDALVVNNCAAAVLLACTAVAAGREVVVSRGELVEIGGGFRVPDILAACGARLVEVGTTNRTRVADYERAITPATAAILRVHRSNFALVGFTEDTPRKDLVALGRARGIPVLEDLGSGALVDTAQWGLPREPTARESITAGVDLVMCSGDKLLGGPQAGVIAGRAAWVERLRKHPLMRALRPGRLVLAALEATLRVYAQGRAATALPAVRALADTEAVVRARADALRATIADVLPGATVVPTEARVGGGAMPTARLKSYAVLPGEKNALRLEAALRAGEPPVVARIESGAVVLDLRAVADTDVPALGRAVVAAMAAVAGTEGDGGVGQRAGTHTTGGDDASDDVEIGR